MRKYIVLVLFGFIFHINLYANQKFIQQVFKQDVDSMFDFSLPLPSYFPFNRNIPYLFYKNDVIDSIFKQVRSTSEDYRGDEKEISNDILQSKIHELEKEAYMLHSQLQYLEERKHNWRVNKKRSGYYIGVGTIFDFVFANQGIMLRSVNIGGLVKFGFLRYFNNHSGLKAEVFGLFNTLSHNNKLLGTQYYGVRFSVMQDVRIFSSQYLGFFAGVGFGGYLINNTTSLGANLHVGVSYTPNKHIRIEIERMFIPHIEESVDSLKNYESAYFISCSWIF